MRDPGLREDRRTEIQVGVFVLLAALALVAGIFWIAGREVLPAGIRVHGVSPEAGQITSGARVLLLGVDVGSVERVRLDGLRVVLDIRVDPPMPLPADTRGVIRPAGFLGAQMVALLPGTAEARLQAGDTIAMGRAPDLQTLAAELGEDAAEVLQRTQRLLTEETVEEVRRSSAAMAAAMEDIQGLVRGQRETLGDLLQNLEQTSSRLAAVTEGAELERTVARLDTLTERLARAGGGLDTTASALASITGRLDRGEGTLGRLLEDEILFEELTAAVENLQFASEEVALLTRDLRERPERYLRGLRFSIF